MPAGTQVLDGAALKDDATQKKDLDAYNKLYAELSKDPEAELHRAIGRTRSF